MELLWRNPLHLSPWLCSPQSKTLEELSEIYASAVDAQELAATSSDPVLARERLQSMLWDIAGAASFPAITGEKPPGLRFPPGFSAGSAPAATSGFTQSLDIVQQLQQKPHQSRSSSITTECARNGFSSFIKKLQKKKKDPPAFVAEMKALNQKPMLAVMFDGS